MPRQPNNEQKKITFCTKYDQSDSRSKQSLGTEKSFQSENLGKSKQASGLYKPISKRQCSEETRSWTFNLQASLSLSWAAMFDATNSVPSPEKSFMMVE